MKKRLLPLAMAFTTAGIAVAATLSPSEALDRAFSSQEGRTLGFTIRPTLVHTSYSTTNLPGAYVFNNADGLGYMVVSADDKGLPLLGYADEGTFDPNNIPPNMQYWLEFYANELAASTVAPAGNQTMSRKPAAETEKYPIPPLMSTKWDQDAPYYNQCPKVGSRYCYTGCVATAMAQIMKFFNYPDRGEGENSYYWDGKRMSMNFASVPFDWNNMLNTYKNNKYSDAQADAVATLMYACGIATNMDYGTGGSGALSYDLMKGFSDFFKYDKQIRYLFRDYYTLEEWQDIIYEELEYARPVAYGGDDGEVGHQFVCDGYSKNGFFHINWGWSGVSDGYFQLTALDPESQGIGGGSSGYVYNQDIVCYIMPDEGGAYFENLMADGAFTVKTITTKLGGNIEGSIETVLNMSQVSVVPILGFAFIAEDGTTTYAEGYRSTSNLRPKNYIRGKATLKAIVPESLTSGTYTVRPAYQDSQNQWHVMAVDMQQPRSAVMNVNGNNVSFTDEELAIPDVTSFQFNSSVYVDTDFSLTFTVVNDTNTKWYGSIYPVLSNGSTMVDYADPVQVQLAGGEEKTIEMNGKFSNITAGDYTFCFCIDDPENPNSFMIISSREPLTVQAVETVLPTITNIQIANQNAVDAANFTMTMTASIASGTYYDVLSAAFFQGGETSSIAVLKSEPLYLNAGDSQEVTISGSLLNAVQPGNEYTVYIFGVNDGQNELLTSGMVFTVADESGIEDVTTAPVAKEYYNLQGVRISQPNDGDLYIVVDKFANGTSRASRQLQK